MTSYPNQSSASHARPAWKQKLIRELIEYGISFLYLAIFFGAFAWYRRLLLAEFRISYFDYDYGYAVIKALILAKVIWLGDLFGLGRKRGNRPLIYSTLQNALMFSALVGLFAIIEHMVSGLLHGKGVAGGLAELWHLGKFELLARALVAFCAFIPFFAFRELGRVLGDGKIQELFFRSGAAVESAAAA